MDELRSYGGEDYVIVSPYPGQDAPVIATSWRVQLKLDGAGDPRLRKFVDQFRISELAPSPATAAPAASAVRLPWWLFFSHAAYPRYGEGVSQAGGWPQVARRVAPFTIHFL